jgi:uncharacterized protein (DUF2249 family)
MALPHLHLSPDAIYPFDARGVAKRFRHAAIFGALDCQRYGERVSVEYRQREPGAIVIDFGVH